MRTVRTASGATAVQIVWGSRQIEHLGSAHDQAKLAALTEVRYHHKRELIEAHLAIVFAAFAVTHRVEAQTGWSIKRFVQTARRYRTIAIRAGGHASLPKSHCPATYATSAP